MHFRQKITVKLSVTDNVVDILMTSRKRDSFSFYWDNRNSVNARTNCYSFSLTICYQTLNPWSCILGFIAMKGSVSWGSHDVSQVSHSALSRDLIDQTVRIQSFHGSLWQLDNSLICRIGSFKLSDWQVVTNSLQNSLCCELYVMTSCVLDILLFLLDFVCS